MRSFCFLGLKLYYLLYRGILFEGHLINQMKVVLGVIFGEGSLNGNMKRQVSEEVVLKRGMVSQQGGFSSRVSLYCLCDVIHIKWSLS